MSIDFNGIKQNSSAHVVVSMHKLNKTLKHVEAYHGQRLSAGVESFDTPADQLVVNGLADMFPSHYVVGSGNEGLGEFIGKLKQGVAGLVKSVKGGGVPKSDFTPLKVALKDVNSNYAKKGFFGGKLFGGPKTSPVGVLQNYVGEGDGEKLLELIEKAIPAAVSEAQRYLKETQAYWAGLSKYIDELKKVGEDDAAEVEAILKRLQNDYGDPHSRIEIYVNRPWADKNVVKAGAKLDVLDESQAEKAGALIKAILEAVDEIQTIHTQLVAVGDYFDVYKELPIPVKLAKKPMTSVLYDFLDWEGYVLPGTSGCALQEEYLLDVGGYLERWIKDSLK